MSSGYECSGYMLFDVRLFVRLVVRILLEILEMWDSHSCAWTWSLLFVLLVGVVV